MSRGIILAKQRNGPTGSVHLTFLSDKTRFVDFTDMNATIEE